MAERRRRHNVCADRDDPLRIARGDQAYPATMSFTVGTFLTAALAAIIGFAALPMLATSVGFSLAIGFVAQGWPSRGRRRCLPA
jgi:hypothetical protein